MISGRANFKSTWGAVSLPLVVRSNNPYNENQIMKIKYSIPDTFYHPLLSLFLFLRMKKIIKQSAEFKNFRFKPFQKIRPLKKRIMLLRKLKKIG